MKKILIGIVGLVVVLIAAAIVIPLFIPVDKYKAEITERTRDATGRDLVIDGPISLSLFPSIALSAEDVRFSNRPGGRAENMATLDRLRVSVKLLPLLTGALEIDGFELVNPVIALEVDRNGTGNWVMGDAGAETQAAPESGGGAGGMDFLNGLSLSDITLENGRISYWDAATNEEMVVENINASLALPAFDKRLSGSGKLDWNGETVDLDFSLDNPRGFLDGAAQPFTMSVSAPRLSLDVDGSARMADEAAVNGTVELDVPSIRELAAWAGTPLDMPGDGLGPLKISGKLAYQGSAAAFTDARIAIDDMNATGSLSVDTGGAVPKVTGRLDVDTLDLNPYMPPPTDEPVEIVWSEEPIDASGLKAANLDFEFTAGQILVQKIRIGKSALDLTVQDGVLTAALTEMALYQGSGQGSVTLDGRQPNLGLAANFALNGVQAEPLMMDAAEMDRLAGTLTTDFDVAANGQSQKALVSTLDGKGTFKFLDGEIRGVNLAKIASTIEGVVNGVSDGGGDFLKTLVSGNVMGTLKNLGAMFGGKGDVNETTKFTSLTGDWTAENGVVSNPNLNMVGPLVNNRALLSMTGKGMLDLPQQTINYEASLRSFSQTDTSDKTGVGGTVRLTGMMTAPDACVVLGKLCIGPGTKPAELVGQKLLGGVGGGGDEASSPEDKVKSVTKGLKGLLGGKKDGE